MGKNFDEPHRGLPKQENPDHDREEVPGRPAVSQENMQQQAQEGKEQQAQEGRGTYLQGCDWFSGGCFEAGESVSSKKHLQSYLDEYAFQYNHRADPNGIFKGFMGRARLDSNLRPSDS